MRHTLRKVVIVVGFFLALGAVDKAACPNAEASYGLNEALGTIGIAAGIGTVMGLSTIAFYDSPFNHMGNALMGAGAGLIVGLGVAAYLLGNSSEDDEITPEELLPPENKPTDSGKKPAKDPAKPDASKKEKTSFLYPGSRQFLASVPATLALRTPTANSGWTVAVHVLELRF